MRKIYLLFIFLTPFFAACSTKEQALPQKTAPLSLQIHQKNSIDDRQKITIIERTADFGFTKSLLKRNIDTLVVHTAYSLDGDPYDPQNVIAVFCKYNVSPHYLIARDGTVFRMVDENDVAHHAGKSAMKDGRVGVNAFSIGVELINSTTDYPTKTQYESLIELVKDIKTRHKIEYIVGHSDIAPDRKTDPWNFDFSVLKMGIESESYVKKGFK